MNEPQRCCPSCGRDNTDQAQSPYSQDDWNLKNCVDCQLLYLENALPYSEFQENYAWGKTYRKQAKKRNVGLTGWLRHKLKRARMRWLPHPKAISLLRRFVAGGKILDIGCGAGRWMRQLDGEYVPFGIEIDKKAAETSNAFAAERGGRVYQTDALSGLQDLDGAQFDCVVMQSYLEHEINPLGVLRATADVLSPQGVVIIKVPNYACWNRQVQGSNWPGFRFPDHVNYFTPSTIRQIVNDAGLDVVRFNLNDRLPTSDNLWMVAGKAA